jgi:hemerythrin
VPLIEDGDRQAGVALIEFLSRWLKDHTALADRMLGAHLRNQDRLHAA